MLTFPQFVAIRIAEIESEIQALPAGYRGERDADGLGIDIEFYKTASEVWTEYQQEIHLFAQTVSLS